MHIVPRDDSTAIAPPNCPNCGLAPSAIGTHVEHDIATANYVCDNQHLWQLKWIEGAK